MDSIKKMVARLKKVERTTKARKYQQQCEISKDQEQLEQTLQPCVKALILKVVTTQRFEKRRRYRPIENVDLQEETCDEYYIMKCTRETLKSVNPYAVVEKVEEVTGDRPKAVTGYNSSSLTVKVESKELCTKF